MFCKAKSPVFIFSLEIKFPSIELPFTIALKVKPTTEKLTFYHYGCTFSKPTHNFFDIRITKSNVYFHKKNLFVQYYFTLIVELGTFFSMEVLFDLYYIP